MLGALNFRYLLGTFILFYLFSKRQIFSVSNSYFDNFFFFEEKKNESWKSNEGFIFSFLSGSV